MKYPSRSLSLTALMCIALIATVSYTVVETHAQNGLDNIPTPEVIVDTVSVETTADPTTPVPPTVAEPDDDVVKQVPLILEIVNGEGGQIYGILYDEDLLKQFESKIDLFLDNQATLIQRVAELEATVLSMSDPVSTPQPSPTPDAEPTPEPEVKTLTVNINTANVIELQQIPGIGPAKAPVITNSRLMDGPFQDWADVFRRRVGIGPATYDDIMLSKVRVIFSDDVPEDTTQVDGDVTE